MQENIKLKNKIVELINSDIEGNNWDFKEQYSDKNEDFIHDVLCLANSSHGEDKYLIYGVTDPPNSEIVGIADDNNRKNISDITSILTNNSFVDGKIPHVELEHLEFEDNIIDVLVIKDTPKFKPFYLTRNCGKVYPFNIYTRINNTNTAKNSSITTHELEILWKNRFGLLDEPLNRFFDLLKDYNGWKFDIGNSNSGYYRTQTEFEIKIEKYDEDSPSFATNFVAPSGYYSEAHLYFKQTRLKILKLFQSDDGRVPIAYPEFETLDYKRKLNYFYYLMNEENGIFHYFLTKGNIESVDRVGNIHCRFLYFANLDDKRGFDEYCRGVLTKICSLEESKQKVIEIAGFGTIRFNPIGDSNTNTNLIYKIYKKWRTSNPLILNY